MKTKHHLVFVNLCLLLIMVGCSDGSERPQATEPNVGSDPGTLDRSVFGSRSGVSKDYRTGRAQCRGAAAVLGKSA